MFTLSVSPPAASIIFTPFWCLFYCICSVIEITESCAVHTLWQTLCFSVQHFARKAIGKIYDEVRMMITKKILGLDKIGLDVWKTLLYTLCVCVRDV